MEIFDLYTAEREKTELTMVRGTPVPEGFYRLVVHVCIFNPEGQMLIQQRQPFKKGWSNLWDISVGGSAVMGDTSRTAVERETLEEYMNLEGVRYIPGYADDTKGRIRVNAFRYAAFCLKMGLKYPGVYLNAVLAQTQGMWDPWAVLDGYKQYFTSPGDPYWEYEKNYFAIVPENEEPVEHRSLAPGILEYYTNIGLRISFEKIPVVRMLFSVGAQLWLTIFLFMYLWYRKKTKLLLPVGVMLLYMIGNAFVPIILLRYFAGIFLCHPMIAAFLLQPSKSESATGGTALE